MSDILQIVASTLATPDAVPSLLTEILVWMVLGAAAAVLVVCAAAAMAQCCSGRRRPHILSILLISVLASASSGHSIAVAQDARLREPAARDTAVREVEPRLVRLWGRDSIRLSVNMCGVQCSNQVSLSPDGRWLLLQGRDTTGERLWLAPTEGGEMIELAKDPSTAGEPQWFPAGDAVAFTSRILGAEEWFNTLLRLPVSTDDGRPRGPARQVSLEHVEPFAVSPDGSAIAYVADQDPYAVSGSALKVIPSTGGNPIATPPLSVGIVMALRWGTDGKDIYCLTWTDINDEELAVHRIPVEGGQPELVSTWDDWVHLSPRARYLVRELPTDETEGHLYEAATLAGRPLVRFRLPGPFELAGFGREPGELLAVRQDIVNPLRVIPVAGGPTRRLNEAWGYDVPLAWTEDGSEVFFRTTLDGERTFMLAPVDGGPMRQVPLPRDAVRPRLSRDGSRVLYFTEDSGTSRGREGGGLGADLFLYEIQTEATLPVETPTDSFDLRFLLSIEGDVTMDAQGMRDAPFAYVITRRGRDEVYLVDRSGSAALAWSLADEAWTPGDHSWGNISIYGNRLAFTETADGKGTLYLATAGDDKATPLLTLPGALATRGSNAVQWSPDGRVLIMSYRAPGVEEAPDLLLVEVDEAGELVGEPRTLSLEGGPDWLYALQWMPDAKHFLAVGGPADGGSESFDVWIVPLEPGSPPVNLTREIDQPIWYYHLSPDGRYIAIESEIPRGSSIWRVDLGDVLSGSAR